MITFALVISLVYPVVMPCSIWCLYCTYRTHEDRMKLITNASIQVPPVAMAYLAALDHVGFNRHMWMRLSFRNPLKLYPTVNITVTPLHGDFGVPGETMQ